MAGQKYSSRTIVEKVCVTNIFIPIITDNRAPSVIQKRVYSLRILNLKNQEIILQAAWYSVVELHNSWIFLVFYSFEMNLDYRINKATFKIKFYYKKYIFSIRFSWEIEGFIEKKT